MKTICIIGGGIIGLCTAYYAARQGHRIILLEKGSPQHDCCSLGNAGMIVPSHVVPLAAPGMIGLGMRMMFNAESPFAIKPRASLELFDWALKFCRHCTEEHVAKSAPVIRDLSLASRICFEELSAIPGGDFGLVKKGLLMLCREESTLHAEQHTVDLAKSLGIPSQMLSAKQTAELDPNITMDIAGSAYFPLDCHLNPSRFFEAIMGQLRVMQCEIHFHTQATGWSIESNRIAAVATNRGDFAADEYVIAGGSWSGQLARELKISLPMQAGKGYSMTLKQPAQLPELCAILTEARVAVTPMGSSLRFAGTMEIAGLDESVDRDRVSGIIKSIPGFYPAFRPEQFKMEPVWSGLRPCSPDGLPYIGRFSRYDNLSTASGHAMMGLSLAPITGKLMADVLSNRPPSINLDALKPDRF